MTTAPDKNTNNWQLSLATILIFIFAVAIWFTLVKLAAGLLLGLLTLSAMVAGLFASFVAWKRRRFAILLLVSLFELLAVGGLVGRTYIHARNFIPRQRTLVLLADGMRQYQTAWNAYPPPPSDPKQCGAALYRYMEMKGKSGAFVPFPYMLPMDRSEFTGYEFQGGLRNPLRWITPTPNEFILIDTGPDGLSGSYFLIQMETHSKFTDANNDGVDDGDDDVKMNNYRR